MQPSLTIHCIDCSTEFATIDENTRRAEAGRLQFRLNQVRNIDFVNETGACGGCGLVVALLRNAEAFIQTHKVKAIITISTNSTILESCCSLARRDDH